MTVLTLLKSSLLYKKNLALIVFVFIANEVFAQSLAINIPANYKACQGGTFKVEYNSTGLTFNSTNTFTIELSNNTGSFTSAVLIGSSSSQLTTDSISITIPAGTVAGTGYSLRIISSSQAFTGYSNRSFTIGTPTATLGTASYNNNGLCAGNTLLLNISGTTTMGYYWTGPSGFTSSQKSPVLTIVSTANGGVYTVCEQWAGGCTGPTSGVVVNIKAGTAPPTPIATTNSPVCMGDTLKLRASYIPGVSYIWRNTPSLTNWYSQNVDIANVSSSTGTTYTLWTVQGGCNSDIVTVSIVKNLTPVVTDALVNSNIDLACPGTTMVLSTSDVGAASYKWTGPNNFSATGRIVSVPNITINNQGIYSVRATGANGCVSPPFNTAYLGIETTNPAIPMVPAWEWGKTITGSNAGSQNLSGNIVRDSRGNVYISGTSNATYIKITPTDSILSLGAGDVFLAKFTSDGTYLWAKNMGSINSDAVGGLAIDENDNVFISGVFGGTTAQFGSITANRIGTNPNLFLAKFDSTGSALWVRQATSGNFNLNNYNIPIKTDKSGACYIASTYNGNLSIGSTTLIGPSAFVAKYDANGSLRWAKRLQGSTGSYMATGITVDNNANCYVAGNFTSWYISLSKFDSTGVNVWAKTYNQLRPGGNTNVYTTDAACRIVTGKNGDIYMTAFYYKFGRTVGTSFSNPERYLVVAKLDANGIVQWYKYVNEYYSVYDLVAIGLDGLDNIYISGKMSGNFSCSNVPGSLSYIAQYNSTGQLNWVKSFPGNTAEISVANDGTLYSVCWFGASANFGDGIVLQGSPSVNYNVGFLKLGGSTHIMNYPSTTLCVGSGMSIPFYVDKTYASDNVFKMQLSDANGNFSNPIVIGSLISITSGTIQCTIPTDVLAGPKYRIRVVSTNPAIIGNNNGADITIKRPIITTGNATNTSFCSNDTIKVPFVISGGCSLMNDNIFKVELSDQYGVFNNPIVIATQAGTLDGTIPAVFPDTLPYGTGYKLRVVSTNPAVIGTELSDNITLYGKLQIISSSTSYCTGDNLTLSASNISGAVYIWSGPGTSSSTATVTLNSITNSNEGTYSVYATIGSCNTPLSSLYIPVFEQKNLDSTRWAWAINTGTNTAFLKHPTDILYDHVGNTYTYGYLPADVDDVGGFPLQKGVYIIKSDTSGNIIWAKTIATSTVGIQSEGIVLDNNNNLYINGFFSTDATISSVALTSYGAKDVFIAKLDTSGNVQWAYRMGGAESYPAYDSDNAGKMELDQSGNVVFAGYYLSGSVMMGTFSDLSGITTIKNTTPYAMVSFIVSYSSAGVLLNYKTFEGVTGSVISMDNSDNMYYSGTFAGFAQIDNIKIEGTSYPSSGNSDVFLVKFNSSWSIEWTKKIGGSGSESVTGIIADNDSSIYLTTQSSGPTLFPSGDNQIGFNGVLNYISRFGQSGGLLWVRDLSQTDIADLNVDNRNNVFISTASTYQYGSGSVVSGCNSYSTPHYYSASYILKYNGEGYLTSVKSAYSNSNTQGVIIPAFTMDESGDIYAAGEYYGTSFYDQLELTNSYGNFIAKLGIVDSLPKAQFIYNNLSCSNDTIRFEDMSGVSFGSITSWIWDFDDPLSGTNNVSNQSTPYHIFSGGGQYDVKLIVTSSFGYKDTIVNKIEIFDSPSVFNVMVLTGDTLAAPNGFGSYNWYCNGVLLTETSNKCLAVVPGNYHVTVENANACRANSDTILYVPIITNITNLNSNHYAFSPNPFENTIDLTYTNGKSEIFVKFINSQGVSVKEFSLTGGNNSDGRYTINCSDLTSGLYHVQIVEAASDDIYNMKVIKY